MKSKHASNQQPSRHDFSKNPPNGRSLSKNRSHSLRSEPRSKSIQAKNQLESPAAPAKGISMHRSKSSSSCIRLRGVHQNTLKGWDLDIPLGQLVVVTGLSGTGKSSLVFDTLHAEGQRRYSETFSPYLRQFLERLERPKVDSIENIRPSIAIEQATSIKTSRSTVGTMTELCDYFKVWFCHNATLFDPVSGKALQSESPATAWAQLQSLAPQEPILITFEIHRPTSMDWANIFETLQTQGFTRSLLNNSPTRLDSLDPEKLPQKAQALTIIQDELSVEPSSQSRFLDSATEAFRFGQGQMTVYTRRGQMLGSFSQTLRSPATGREFKAPTPALFSFNSPVGACPQCRGFGRVIGIDPDRVIPDTSLTLLEGAIKPFQGAIYQESLNDLKKFAKKLHIRLDVPWEKLTEHERTLIWRGEPDYGQPGRTWPKAWYGIDGFFKWLDSKAYKMHVRVFLSKYRSYNTCPSCQGARLQPDALNFKWNGKTIPELYTMPVRDLLDYLKT
ncbi:MAG TPA: excinuclease ABC subunit A, partial [Opitutales bacterium]|nr:excinuclease ABC subunit A [Opitutales bacterium]